MRWLVILGILLALGTWFSRFNQHPAPYQVRVDNRDYHRNPSEDTWRYWAYKTSDGRYIFWIEK